MKRIVFASAVVAVMLLHSFAHAESFIPTCPNVITNPGFELDWVGWAMGPWTRPYVASFPGVRQTGIDHNVALHGSASLRIEPNASVQSDLYPVTPGQKYTVSFYARTEAIEGKLPNVRVFVWPPRGEGNKLVLIRGKDIGPDWKRYSLSFVPADFGTKQNGFGNQVSIRFDSECNTLWVDDVQLEKGDMTPFQTSPQAALLTDSIDDVYSQGTKAQAQAVVSVPGAVSSPLALIITSRDVYGKVLWTEKLSIPTSSQKLVKSPVSLRTGVIGVEDVETDLLSASGTSMFKSHFRYCVIAGRETDTKPNPLLGNENAIGDYPLWLLARQEHMSSVVGAGYSRVLSWYDAKGRGTDFGRHSADADDLQKIKAEIDIKKRAGRRVILLIEPVSDCKIRSGMKLDEDISDELVDSDVHAFANHAANVAAALKNDVDCYELINEPNIWFAGSGAKNHQLLMPPDRYAKYVIEGVKAIRQVYPEARIAANINGIHPDYVEGVLAAGAAPYIDEFTYHAYRGTPETPPICNEISALRKVVDKYKPGLPIENDEQYYGTREDPFGTTLAEYDRDYVSDTEREQTGRLLQTCLHCLSQKSSYCMFWTSASIYEYGDSSPWFLYYTFGGFRFISQMLHDIANTRRIDIDSGVRAFAFERADGTIIVSINSRAFDRPGTILRSKADAAYDLNGNPLPTNATPFSYLPSYLVYNKGKTIDQVTSGIAHAGLTGFAEPVQAAFKVTSGVLHLIVTNASNQPVSAKISFTQMPKGWGTPADFKLDDLGPHASKTFVLANDIPAIKWWMTTNVSYHVSGGSFDYVKTGRIATIYVPKAKIDIASGFQDWVSIKRINLGIYSLSYDFSMGKLLHKDPNELSADVGLAWDENAFYVDVNVKTPVFDPGYFDDMYNHSSVQLYFDLLDHAGPTYDDGCCVYTIGWDSSKQLVAYLDQAPGGRYIGEANKTTGVDGEVKLNWKKTDKGYRIEMAFPKSTLPFLALKPGSDFGFSCLINDNHGQGRMAGITLGPDGTEPYQNPSIWREVELAP